MDGNDHTSKAPSDRELLEDIYKSVEKTRKYFLWTMVLTLVLFILPLIIILFALPSIISTLTSTAVYGGL